jgi:hypothetical protein
MAGLRAGPVGGVWFSQPGDGAVEREIQKKLRERVSVKDFGAVGDGVTDDIDAINKAVAASYANNGGAVFFPRGDYIVSSTIELLRTTLLVGEAWIAGVASSRIKLADGADCDIIRTEFQGASYNATTDYIFGGGLRCLAIDGNKANQTGANDPVTGELPVGVNAKHWIKSELVNVDIRNCKGYGLWWGSSSNTCTIRNTFTARNGKSGVYINNSTPNCRFEDLASESNDDYGVEMGVLATDLNGSMFENCSFEYNRKGDFNFLNGASSGVVVISPRSMGITYSGGAITSGDRTLTISSGGDYEFQASDVGAAVHVPGAGSGGGVLTAIIDSYNSATSVEIDRNASTTVSGKTVSQGANYTYTAGPTPRLVVIDGTHNTNRPIAINDVARSTFTLESADTFTFYVQKGNVHVAEGAVSNGATWTTLTLSNWSNSPGAPYATASYLKDATGTVRLRGHVSQSSGTVIATLPSGYRPAADLAFATGSVLTGAIAILNVKTDGTINHVSGATAQLAMNFSFPAA